MAGTEALVEETITAADAEGLLPLSVEAGWNQTADDWRFLLASGQGVGVRDSAGRWLGSALALPLGGDLSWLSMVLVAKAARRRGIGTRLLRRCIDAARAGGTVAGLDATELGRPIYLPLGFRDLYAVSRWHIDGGRIKAQSSTCTVRSLAFGDLAGVVAFDAQRSAMQRSAVLRYLAGQAPHQAFVAKNAGRTSGYALGRPGRIAPQIGPVVAEDEATALALIAHALGVIAGAAILDVPDAHRGLSDWLAAHGAVRQRGFVRMALGQPADGIADPRWIFALAGPELG